MYATLRDFLNELESTGELHRISAPVSPLLEISEISDRVSKSPCARESLYAATFDPGHARFGGKALLFENVEGCDFPLAINVFGSYRRMEMALGVDRYRHSPSGAEGHSTLSERGGTGGFEAIAAKIASLTKPTPPASVGDLLSKAREFLPLLRIPPKRVRKGRCQEVVKLASRREVNLMRLPLIKCWPLDGDPRKVGYDFSPEQSGTAKGEGRYITFAGMHTIHYDDREKERPPSHNIGMYRAQLIDESHLAMHWHMHHDGAAHWRSWKEANAPMPIAICFGGEAVLPYAATAPMPPGMSELLMAGFLNGRGIPLVRAKTVPLWVPANSEIVIEGWVSTECGGIGWEPGTPSLREGSDEPNHHSERRGTSPLGPGAAFEGPFGDHTGYYSMPDRYPIVEVSAITHRRDAIFPATIVGLPPQEDYYLGKATERIFLPLLKTIVHDIDDYHLPMFGAFHNCAFIRIRKAYPLQGRRVMHAVWGAGQMSWTKFIFIVDESVDVHDEEAVLNAVFENCHFGRDLEMVNGPLDILDHAAPRLGAGHKLGFDATRKIEGESVNGVPWDTPPGGQGRRDPTLRLSFVPVAAGSDAAAAISAAAAQNPSADLMIALDAWVDVSRLDDALFHFCANCDPGRDLVVLSDPSPGDARFGRCIAFDATTKQPSPVRGRRGEAVRPFPPFITMDEDTKSRVTSRWREYGF